MSGVSHETAEGSVQAQQAAPAAEPRVPLALAIHRGGLGYELTQPHPIGPLRLTALDVSLPGLRFPLDVTGGLARFRHRRGVLEHVAFEVTYAALERFFAQRLRGLLGTGTPQVQIARVSSRELSVCVTDRAEQVTHWLRTLRGGEQPRALPRARVLAFDVLLDTGDTDTQSDTLRVLIARARGAGLDLPPTLAALRALDSLAAAVGGERIGSAVHVQAAARALARELLPLAGLRAPDTAQVRWQAHRIDDGAIVCLGSRSSDSTPKNEDDQALLARWRESWRILAEVDDVWMRGDEPQARGLLLRALERAPKLPEALRRLAEIDATAASERAEAALGTLRERELGPLGTLGADLAAASGDPGAEIGALLHEAAHEAAPALAAELCVRAAEREVDADAALRWLDLALAHVPGHLPARAARFYRRLCAGKNALAQADVEHLEAQAREGQPRHELLLALGQLYASSGRYRECASFFERALRQLPDDPTALAGLGAALAQVGRSARGAALLARAIDLADPLDPPGAKPRRARRRAAATATAQSAEDTAVMRVQLAELLAEQLGDEPAALARLALVPEAGLAGLRARALEARYRVRLGERAAASLAYGRLRELARSFAGEPGAEPSAGARLAADALQAAARFEEHERGDLQSASRHLAVAVALCPGAPALRAEYQALLQRATPAPNAPEPPAAPPPAAPPTAAPLAAPTETDEAPDDEILAEDLRHRFLQNPHDTEVQSALVRVLERTGRGLELLALVVGMLEDAPDEASRQSLLPVRNRVLEQLESSARARGSDAEADLYRMSRES